MEIYLLDWIFLTIYVGFIGWIIFIKRYSIWKGICGGNGVPQPNELVKIPAFMGICYSIAYTTILHYDPNTEMLIFLATIIGVTSISNIKNPLKKKGNESE